MPLRLPSISCGNPSPFLDASLAVDPASRRKARVAELQGVENISAHHELRFLGDEVGRVVLAIGGKRFSSLDNVRPSEFSHMLRLSYTRPVCFGTVGTRRYWRFQGRWFWDNQSLSTQQVGALIVTIEQRRQADARRARPPAPRRVPKSDL